MKSARFIKEIISASAIIACLGTSAVSAAPIFGGPITPDVIYGSGNANGSFTGNYFEFAGVELGLRAHLRYNTSGNPENTFNYSGFGDYTFSQQSGNAPAGSYIFNIDWSINTDVSGQSGYDLNDLIFRMRVDTDPTAGEAWTAFFDPINVAFADHSIGDNSTGNGAGVEATDAATYAALIANNNVAQNSWNFGLFTGLPQQVGTYTVQLSAESRTGFWSMGNSINIHITDEPAAGVPLPPTLPLMMTSLVLLGLMRRKQRKVEV